MTDDQFISDLQKIGFLKNNEGIDVIRGDLHYTKLWADSFWRRRFSHERRSDPELDVVRNLKFQNVLEIGPAYGRFAYKLLAEHENINYTGIEVCSHFQDYHDEYARNKSNKMNLIFLNFFKDKIEGKFDLIIFPMNSVPGLPFQAFSPLFEKIKLLLNENGKFVFSTYKLPDVINEKNISNFTKNHIGELLIDNDRITLEVYQLEIMNRDYGAHSTNVQLYHRLDNKYNILERELFWTQDEYLEPKALNQIISDAGLKFNIDKSGHSTVYTVYK